MKWDFFLLEWKCQCWRSRISRTWKMSSSNFFCILSLAAFFLTSVFSYYWRFSVVVVNKISFLRKISHRSCSNFIFFFSTIEFLKLDHAFTVVQPFNRTTKTFPVFFSLAANKCQIHKIFFSISFFLSMALSCFWY